MEARSAAAALGCLFALLAPACGADSTSGSLAPDTSVADTGGAEIAAAPVICGEDQCQIGGRCVDNGAVNPDNPCEGCRVILATRAWSPREVACDDDDPCTTDDVCDAGVCRGAPKLCDDHDRCTRDGCDPETGACTAEPAPELCGKDPCDGLPAGACDDGSVCTLDACEPWVGCVHTAVPGACDDGDACTEGDQCLAGLCVGVARSCDDGDVCTIDTCHPDGGCVHTSLAELCRDDNPCTDEACDPVRGCVYAFNTAPCDDGNACTEADTCDGGACRGTPTPLDDGNVCTDDLCDPALGISHVPNAIACDDGDACTVGDICRNRVCVPGATPLPCDDGNLCTSDACDPATGCVNAFNQLACDDASACTVFDRCEQGACVGLAVDCDDHNACTLDSCNPAVGCRHDLVVSNACRPTITITSPVRGATLQGAAPLSMVAVTGKVTSGAGSITSLTINGMATSVNAATGAFSRSIVPTQGGNILVVEATDALGTTRRHVSSFLWSTAYHKPTTPRNGMVTEGVGVWLGKNAIDDGSRALPPNDLGTIFELVLKGFDIAGLLPSPAARNVDAGGLIGTYNVYLSNFTYSAPTVALKPINGGLNMRATIRNGRMNVRAVKTCSAGFFDCWGPSPVTGSITFSSIVIDLDVSVWASASHDVMVSVPRAVVTINGVETHIDGVLGPLLDFVLGFFLDDLVDGIEDAFASQIKPVLEPLVRDALRALAFSTSFSVPKVQGGGNIGVDVVTDFQTITFGASGGRFVLRAGGYHSPQVTPYLNLGIPDRRSCGAGAQPLVNPGIRDLELVLADDTLNQLLYAAWRGGLLEFPVPASWLQGTDLTSYGITNLTLTVSGMLAPTASDCGGGGLKAHIGDIKILANLKLFGQPLTATIWASLVANLSLSQSGGAISAKITGISRAETQVDVAQEGLIGAEGAIQDLIEEQVIGGLLGSLAGTELGSIPLPDIDLSGALPSLPPGTGISIVPQTLYRSSGNTVVGGRLGQ